MSIAMRLLVKCFGCFCVLNLSMTIAQAQAPAIKSGKPADLRVIESTSPAAANNDNGARVTDQMQVRFTIADMAGQPKALNVFALSGLVNQSQQIAAGYPCGDELLPDLMKIRVGNVELEYKIKESCETGKGGYYVPGTALQRKFRPTTGGAPTAGDKSKSGR